MKNKEKEIKNIIEKYYSKMLTELDEIIDIDNVELSIEIQNEGFSMKLN